MQDAHAVLRAEHVRGADRDRLLAAAVVEASRHLALPVEGDPALLGRAHHRHVPQQVRPVLAGEPGLGGRLPVTRARAAPAFAQFVACRLARDSAIDWLHLSALRVWPPLQDLLRAGLAFSPLRDLLRDAYGRQEPGVPPALPMSGPVRAAGLARIATQECIPGERCFNPRAGESRDQLCSARRRTARRIEFVASTWPRVPITARRYAVPARPGNSARVSAARRTVPSRLSVSRKTRA